MAGLLSGCGKDQSKMTDAELGLNAQQSQGRKVYNIYCLSCHPAYSTHGDKGPGLKSLGSKQPLMRMRAGCRSSSAGPFSSK